MDDKVNTEQTKTSQKQTENAIVNGNGEYYRWQPDRQNAVSRNARQSKIFNEYFVVKNIPTEKKVLGILIFGLIVGVVGAILGIVGIVKENLVMAIIGGVAFLIGGACVYAYQTGKRVTYAPARVMSDREYEQEVSAKISEMNIARLAQNRLGLTDEDIKSDPIIITTKVRTPITLVNFTPDKSAVHFSTYETSVIFDVADKLYLFKIQFDMCCDSRTESVSEFFKTDICDVHAEVNVSPQTVLVYSTNIVTAKCCVTCTNSAFWLPLDTDKNINDQIAIIRAAALPPSHTVGDGRTSVQAKPVKR